MTAKIKRAWYYTRPYTKPGMRESGPHGVTKKMIDLSEKLWLKRYPNKPEPRDRSLRGKQRRIQRKASQRRPLTSSQDW